LRFWRMIAPVAWLAVKDADPRAVDGAVVGAHGSTT
jgi:hypothetical protein